MSDRRSDSAAERRSRRTLTSELSEISGIGLKTTQKLLTHFGSLAKIREASVEDLQSIVKRPQAEALWRHFHVNGGGKMGS